MKRHVITLILALLASGVVVAQQPSREPAPPAPTQDEHHHLSKREKKELKKQRDEERKAEKHRLKREAEEHKKADKDHEKELAKQRKHDRKTEEKEIAKERHEDRKQEEKERKEASNGGDHPSMVGRTASLATAPFRLALHATPSLLRAQRDVGRAIYSQMPTSNVAVLLSDAGQIVLRGAAPSPSLRSRLLQLATGAAGGYPIVDELASQFAGDVASAAAGKVSDMIHSNPDDSGASGPPPSDAVAQSDVGSPAPSQPAAGNTSAFEGGSRACANVAGNNRVVLTGQATSQATAELIRQFASQLGGASASLDDQLVTRSNGTTAENALPATEAGTAPAPALTPGSTVCVNMTTSNEVLLTGTVASSDELASVERAAQPLAAGARLTDQLTIGTLPASSTIAATGGNTGIAANPTAGASNAVTTTETTAGSAVAANTGVAPAESELEQALHSVPRLANVDVQLTGDTVRLSGSVDTTQDEQSARDIARQHAPGRSVVDNLSVAGRSPAPMP